jgi:hypothetical protein
MLRGAWHDIGLQLNTGGSIWPSLHETMGTEGIEPVTHQSLHRVNDCISSPSRQFLDRASVIVVICTFSPSALDEFITSISISIVGSEAFVFISIWSINLSSAW